MQTFEAVGIQGDNGQMRALDLFKGQHFNSEFRAHYVIAKDRQLVLVFVKIDELDGNRNLVGRLQRSGQTTPKVLILQLPR